MNHEPFDTLAAIYAVGALDGEDRAQFEAHLAAGCAECEATVRESYEALAALTREVPRAIPPAHVKEALLRRIAEKRARRPSPASSPWRWLLGSAVAAVLLVGFTAGFVAARYEARLGQMARETAAIRERLDQDRAEFQAQLASYRDVVELLRDPATRVVTLHGQGQARDALARVVWNDRTGGHIFVAKLQPAPEGKTYELWTIGVGAPHPAGLVAVQEAFGQAGLRVDPLPAGEPVKVFAVTLEPAGGTPAPTGPMILASK